MPPPATRQTTPGAAPVVLAPTNSLKRALSEDADSDTPDPKKIKLKSENTLQGKDKDKKKRKKKKKKKTPIVVPLELPTANANAAPDAFLLSPAPTPSGSSMNSKGKRKATPEPPQDKLGGEQAVAPKELEPESPSDTIARLTQELGAQSLLLKKHETTLTQFNQSLTCQVCLDLLHKPYALAPCGHIACYNCLVAWFTSEPDEPRFGAPRKKTCPHCRATVKERPVEVWNVKDMVAGLLRSGLVRGLSAGPPPPPELPGTPQVADAPADPWHNIFRYPHQHPRFHLPGLDGGEPPSVEDMGMLDTEDGGVYRCLDCMHEIWDGVCTSCHRVYPGHTEHFDNPLGAMFGDSDDSDDDGGPEFWPLPIGYGAMGMGPLPLPLPFEGAWWNGEDSDDESRVDPEDEIEDGDVDDSFIDDRIIEINDSDSERGSSLPPPRLPPPGRRGSRRVTLVSSDDEEEAPRRRRAPSEDGVIVVSDDDDADIPPRPQPRRRRATHGRARPAQIASDEDEDDDGGSSTASTWTGERVTMTRAEGLREERMLMDMLRAFHGEEGRESDEGEGEGEGEGEQTEGEGGRTDSEEEQDEGGRGHRRAYEFEAEVDDDDEPW
ncbi:hypothetical protein B0H17DRAFT_1193649 [Mycena rosella]|uniref:RING-type domain-containing protein n=1 Tax=Mycena rosella TaxID=1033263 RepID=A0AAD7GSL4_MYCRO|nr:hypothetical protein B0H17DRAFT_1193649 [Mycena rosella]